MAGLCRAWVILQSQGRWSPEMMDDLVSLDLVLEVCYEKVNS